MQRHQHISARLGIAIIVLAGCAAASPNALRAETVDVITIDGPINVVAYSYLADALKGAAASDAECLVVQLDTPGGDLGSTKKIIQAMLAAKTPVVVFVRPPGSHAASAGTFLLMAGHVAAMAPTTRTGAAHPVFIGPIGLPGPDRDREKKEEDDDKSNSDGKEKETDHMMEKVLNDSVASIRGIARARGRNADWAEKAVRGSAVVEENEALELNVIDLIADDLDDLLNKIDVRTSLRRQLRAVKMQMQLSGAVGPFAVGDVRALLALARERQHLARELRVASLQMHTAGARLRYRPMSWRQRVLYIIADPNIFYILFLFGIYGIIYELMRPGMIFPGVVGAVCLILAFFAMQVLPVHWAGALLILLGIGLLLAEIKITSYGLLTVGGIICLTLGSLMLIKRADGEYMEYLRISWMLILAAVLTTAGIFILFVTAGLVAQRRKVTTGREGLVGQVGVAHGRLDPEGTVFLHGELWRAVADQPIEERARVTIVRVDGMTLHVTKAD